MRQTCGTACPPDALCKGVMSEAARHDFNHLPPGAAGLGHVFARPKLVAVLCVVVLAGLGWLYLALLLAGMKGHWRIVRRVRGRHGAGALPAIA